MNIQLPEGWTYEEDKHCGTILHAPKSLGGGGAVTVNEKARNFELGMVSVHTRGSYAGRNWKKSLYSDAISTLTQVLSN